jgi:hypothetical protein
MLSHLNPSCGWIGDGFIADCTCRQINPSNSYVFYLFTELLNIGVLAKFSLHIGNRLQVNMYRNLVLTFCWGGRYFAWTFSCACRIIQCSVFKRCLLPRWPENMLIGGSCVFRTLGIGLFNFVWQITSSYAAEFQGEDVWLFSDHQHMEISCTRFKENFHHYQCVL